MAIGDHFSCLLVPESPRGAQADDDPLGLQKMHMSRFQAFVDPFQKFSFRSAPKGRIVAESTILPLAYCNHILVCKQLAIAQPFY